MKKASDDCTAICRDIALIQATLADLRTSELINMSMDEVSHLVGLLNALGSEDKFSAAFPKNVVMHYHEHIRFLTKSKKVRNFVDQDEQAEWCYGKMRRKVKKCAFKVYQMLEGANFRNYWRTSGDGATPSYYRDLHDAALAAILHLED